MALGIRFIRKESCNVLVSDCGFFFICDKAKSQTLLDLKNSISECSAYLVGLAMRARPIRAVNMSNSAVRKIS